MNKYITKWQYFLVLLKMVIPRYKALMGFCPYCNSDAPEVDDCAFCDSWSQHNIGKFPPPTEKTREWVNDLQKTKEMKYQILNAVNKARKDRLK